MIYEVDNMVGFLEACKEMVGQEGPFFFLPQIQDPPPRDKFAIGEIGRAVTWDDILATFNAVAGNRDLGAHFYDQGHIFFEGVHLRDKTLYMRWGS
eukprot:scaffold24574_cov139-Skeletonema_marinoi.AAC.1